MSAYYCAACGHKVPVRIDPTGAVIVVGRCAVHPQAKRMTQRYVKKKFAAMKDACKNAPTWCQVMPHPAPPQQSTALQKWHAQAEVAA